ncbi:hypothetical protein [Blastococcus sp. URHD0036]|uniref:hypothetical protein n=1 Tax=Blastococcus sp. URHD0036 TaxID=1380356 RepID=UPI00068C6870|nr:hypothetical protein [Blastococcus sp. URHD0036]
MSTIDARLAMACAATLLALGLAACDGSTATSSAGTVPSATATSSSSTSGTESATDSPTTAAGTRVSANTASADEIAAALESAGVSNAERWAEEVVEYRPYPTDDPDLTRLRDNLAKYNPGQETVDKIVSALMP